MDKFVYEEDLTREINYSRWKIENDREKFIYNERPYTDEQGKKIFDKMYPKINKQNGIPIDNTINQWSYDANGKPIESG